MILENSCQNSVYLETIRSDIPDEYELPLSWVSDWKATLEHIAFEIYTECSSPNWDGYNALPMKTYAINWVASLIGLLPLEVTPPDIVPENTGDIGLEWRIGNTKIMTLSVVDGKLIYAAILGEHDKRHGEEPFNVYELPEQIKKILLKHFRQ